jgi:hypothetical protein
MQGFASAEITDEDDRMILECLEHVNFCGSVIFKASLLLSWFLIVYLFMQALVLSRNKDAKRVMEIA